MDLNDEIAYSVIFLGDGRFGRFQHVCRIHVRKIECYRVRPDISAAIYWTPWDFPRAYRKACPQK